MGIEKLMDIYNPLAKMTEQKEVAVSAGVNINHAACACPGSLPRQAMNHWKDSAAVVRLSEYMKQCRQHGIGLHLSPERSVVLSFNPGLKASDVARKTELGILASNAVDLLLAAADDLQQLLSEGLLDLPSKPVVRHANR